jgi:hypothetical protein
MPFKSQAQQAYMFSQHPKMAKEWASEMSSKDFEKLPEKKSSKRVRKIVDKIKKDHGS